MRKLLLLMWLRKLCCGLYMLVSIVVVNFSILLFC